MSTIYFLQGSAFRFHVGTCIEIGRGQVRVTEPTANNRDIESRSYKIQFETYSCASEGFTVTVCEDSRIGNSASAAGNRFQTGENRQRILQCLSRQETHRSKYSVCN